MAFVPQDVAAFGRVAPAGEDARAYRVEGFLATAANDQDFASSSLVKTRDFSRPSMQASSTTEPNVMNACASLAWA